MPTRIFPSRTWLSITVCCGPGKKGAPISIFAPFLPGFDLNLFYFVEDFKRTVVRLNVYMPWRRDREQCEVGVQ
jgi:hypothetical protein